MKLLTIALFFTVSLEVQAVTAFHYHPGPRGSYVAGNSSDTVTPEDSWVFEDPSKVYRSKNVISFEMTGPTGDDWDIWIEMPQGQLLRTGWFVGERFLSSENSTVGFDWSGHGRGSNTLTAVFNILEVEYEEDQIIKFAVDFVQFENTWGNLMPSIDTHSAAFGSYRFNSSVPLSIPEPSSLILVFSGGWLLIGRRR